MALTGVYLVPPVTSRFAPKTVILTTLLVMLFGVLAFMLDPVPILFYVLLIPIVVAFAINYPQMITLFSLSVDESDQGWVMGISIALFTLGSALISLVGGPLMAINIHLPFILSIGAAVTALLLVSLLSRSETMSFLNKK